MTTPSPVLSAERDRPAPAVDDVIDHLLDIQPGDALDRIRAQRAQARSHAQQSYLSLFHPAKPVVGHVSRLERQAVALFVALLHRSPDVARFYEQGLHDAAAPALLLQAIDAASQAARHTGPYGHYPEGPLTVENTDGPRYAVAAELRPALGNRLAAAFDHVHLLVFHPRDASPAAVQALLDNGWDTTDIVILSQLVAFLSFQIRVVQGPVSYTHLRAHET